MSDSDSCSRARLDIALRRRTRPRVHVCEPFRASCTCFLKGGCGDVVLGHSGRRGRAGGGTRRDGVGWGSYRRKSVALSDLRSLPLSRRTRARRRGAPRRRALAFGASVVPTHARSQAGLMQREKRGEKEEARNGGEERGAGPRARRRHMDKDMEGGDGRPGRGRALWRRQGWDQVGTAVVGAERRRMRNGEDGGNGALMVT